MADSSLTDCFADCTALVTGASSGIGYETALALGKAGARVGLNYRSNRTGAEKGVEQIRNAGGEAIAIQADVSQAEEVDRMFQQLAGAFGDRIELLVNNAGQWMDRCPLVDCTDAQIDQMWQVNARSVLLCCRAAARKMIAQREGSIVNVSSVVGHSGGGGGTLPYAAAKAAVNTLTRGLARELGPHGIRVNGIAPGVVDTPMMTGRVGPELRAKVEAMTPLGRLGEPREIASAILSLLSPASSFISGTILDVDGGYLTR